MARAGVISCPTDTPLRGVAHLMATHRLHCVVVYDYGSEADEARLLWGIVSDLDLAAAAAAGALDSATAGSVAATPALTIRAEAGLGRAAQLMAEHGVSHLVVVEPGSGRPTGVVSTLDLAVAVAP